MQVLRNVSLVAVLFGLLLVGIWPAILNSYPFFHGDTPSYIRYVDVAVAKVTGRTSDWSTPTRALTPNSASTAPKPVDDDRNEKTPFAGRSIYYGALLELGDAIGSIWLCVAVQSAVFMAAIALLLHNTVGFTERRFAGLAVGLSLTTPVAFFASYLMPDLFAGVTIIGVAALLIYGNRMTRRILLVWGGLLSAALLVHSTHVLIAGVLLGVGLIGRFLFHTSVSPKGLIGVAFGLAVAFVGDVTFTVATSKMFGVTPIRPPFLMARVISDGPGAAFMRDRCPQANFTVCRFVDRLPISTAHIFLWSADPGVGVFSPADSPTKRALADEQFRFVYAVFRYDPAGVVVAALRNTLDQSITLSLREFNLNDDDRYSLIRNVPGRHLRNIERTKGWADTLPVGVNSYALIHTAQSPGQEIAPETPGWADGIPGGLMLATVLIVLLTSIGYVACVLARRDYRTGAGHDLQRLAVIMILGILVNAFVCGALSEPYERYQARVIWLIPLLAALVYIQRRGQRAVAEPSAQPRKPRLP